MTLFEITCSFFSAILASNYFFLLLGAFFSWYFTYLYYKKSSDDQEKLFKIIPKEIRTAIIHNPDSKIIQDSLSLILVKLKEYENRNVDGGNF